MDCRQASGLNNGFNNGLIMDYIHHYWIIILTGAECKVQLHEMNVIQVY